MRFAGIPLFIAYYIFSFSVIADETVPFFVADAGQKTFPDHPAIKNDPKKAQRIQDAVSPDEIARARENAYLFRKAAKKYDLDWLMLLAQGYQESRLDQSAVSPGGALGIMQILPSTAADRNVDIPDISTMENNLTAGAKYMRFIMNRYISGEGIDPLNRHLLALASYNAGPARISRLRKQAAKRGLDPNKWFRNVEYMVAEKIGQKSVDYVLNIYLLYGAYKQVMQD